MSETVSQIFISDELNESEHMLYVQYECSNCGTRFNSENDCDEHILACTGHTDLDGSCGESIDTCNDRAPKRKLEKPVSESGSAPLDILEDCSSNDIQEGASVSKRVKGSEVKFKREPENIQLESGGAEIVYEITSEMLSDNEMLITLPYTECNDLTLGPVEFANEISVGFEQHAEELNNIHDKHHENLERSNANNIFTIENNNEDDPSNTKKKENKINILRVVKTKPRQVEKDSKTADNESSHESVLIDNDMEVSKDPQDESNVKIFTVLSNVNVNQPISREIVSLPSNTECEEATNGFEFQREVLYESEDEDGNLGNSVESEDSRISTNSPIKNKKHKPIVQSNKTESENKPIPETSKITTPTEEGKFKTNNITVLSKEKINKKIPLKPQKLYKKIPKQPVPKPAEPDKFAVYDFFDEDEEEKNKKLRQELQKIKELSERTCRLCSEVFEDPMDVLRHKRQFHKYQKICLPREELEPYLQMKDQTSCPLCFKVLGKVFKSIYVKHIMIHCEEYSFQCGVCGMRFRRKDHWYNHESRHVVKPNKVDSED